jgi:glycosyltransferase involved in cell wall biosynthesis
MKISLITVSYNSSKTIEDTIKCVLSQSHENIEYIVVDGNSKDGTQDIIKKYEQGISKIISEPDYGIYDAMNKGIRAATGDVIGFLNADDTYVSDKVLEKVAEAFTENDTDSVYGDLCYVSEEDTSKVLRFWAGRSMHEDKLFERLDATSPHFFCETLGAGKVRHF